MKATRVCALVMMTTVLFYGLHWQSISAQSQDMEVQNIEPCLLSLAIGSNNTLRSTRTARSNDLCEHLLVPMISVFDPHCANLTLLWFQRMLYSQLFIIALPTPKYIFMAINNPFDGHQCGGLSMSELLDHAFIPFVGLYFDWAHLNVFLHDQPMSVSEQRHFLAQNMQLWLDTRRDDAMAIQQDNHIAVSLFDGDITHPQSFEVMDHLYADRDINASALSHCFANLQLLWTDQCFVNFDNYKL